MKFKTSNRFEGYTASESGKIYSHRKKGNKVFGKRGGTAERIDFTFRKELKGWVSKKGYILIGIREKDKRRSVGAHQIVADAFHGQCPDGLQVRHLDGNPKNNHFKNLVYGTINENNQDKKLHGTYLSGGDHQNAKLTQDQADEIRVLRTEKVKVKELASMFGVSRSTIESIIYRKSYL